MSTQTLSGAPLMAWRRSNRTFLVSDALLPGVPLAVRVAVIKYAVHSARNPDKGSNFESMTRRVRRLWWPLLIGVMLYKGYDGLVLFKDGCIVGHLFFHSKKDGLHLFDIYTHEEHRRRGVATKLIDAFLEHAWTRTSHRAVRIGELGTPELWSLRDKLRGDRGHAFYVLAGNHVGWFSLVPRTYRFS